MAKRKAKTISEQNAAIEPQVPHSDDKADLHLGTFSKGGKASEDPQASSKDFESFYLQQLTTEFADDLDRLRNANDFNDNSVPVLIEALKQTAKVYTEEEKEKVMKYNQ
ncbi:MAG: hypothetical protein Q9191_004151 [Dirinaria sp. TL-2023a]